MRRLFKELTTEENIMNFGRIIAMLIIVACAVIIIRVISHPELISLPTYR
jgi:hypothetical protein